MNTIEKEILVESLMNQIWSMYLMSIIGSSIVSKNVNKPRLVCICKGIGAAGRYYASRGIVEINVAYYNGDGNTSNLETTIAHEIAHHIAHCIWPNASQWHGPEFRMVMNSIGYDGDTYHSMSRNKAKAVAQKSKDELFDL